jgi:hypothetical protein
VCQLKEITRCAEGAGVKFLRKIRDMGLKEDNEKFKIDKVFLCKPHLSSLKGLFYI